MATENPDVEWDYLKTISGTPDDDDSYAFDQWVAREKTGASASWNENHTCIRTDVGNYQTLNATYPTQGDGDFGCGGATPEVMISCPHCPNNAELSAADMSVVKTDDINWVKMKLHYLYIHTELENRVRDGTLESHGKFDEDMKWEPYFAVPQDLGAIVANDYAVAAWRRPSHHPSDEWWGGGHSYQVNPGWRYYIGDRQEDGDSDDDPAQFIRVILR